MPAKLQDTIGTKELQQFIRERASENPGNDARRMERLSRRSSKTKSRELVWQIVRNGQQINPGVANAAAKSKP